MSIAVTVVPESRRIATRDGVGYEVVRSTSDATIADSNAVLPLVLLHGFTGAAATWNELLPAFASRRETMALSLPGHGGSDSPGDPSRYAAHRVAEDVIELLDTLGIRRAALLGYSMGARVALHAALAAPERVGALILESGSPGIANDAERAARRAADEALAREIERDGVEAFVDRWERLPLWASQRAQPRTVRESLRVQRLANGARGLANALRGLGAGATPQLHERLAELADMPVLLVCGSLDEKYVRIAREMAATLPRADLRVVEHAGHAVHLESPREMVRVVEEFLGGIDRHPHKPRHPRESGADCHPREGGADCHPREGGDPCSLK